MRVGFFVNYFPSGSLTFVNSQLTGLIDRGFDVQIVSQRPKRVVPLHEDVDRYGLLGRTHYWHAGGIGGLMSAASTLWQACRQPQLGAGRLSSALLAQGVANTPQLVRRAATVAALPKFDAIICHFGPVGLQTQQLRDIGVLDGPMMTFFHGYDVSRWVEQHGDGAYRPLFERCERLVAVSQYWASRLAQLGCPPQRLSVHRMGVDCRRIAFQARTAPPNGPVNITTVARFTEKKGIEYALRAVAAVHSQTVSKGLPHFHYHLVGDGEQRAHIERWIVELGLAPMVTLHGWKTQQQVASLLEQTHLFLLPSVTAEDGDQEGIPVALMEAVAAGIPVVSTRHTGIPELVRHGDGQLLVPERDSVALAAALVRLLAAPESWAAIGRQGRQIVETDFDVERLNDDLAATLTNLVRHHA